MMGELHHHILGVYPSLEAATNAYSQLMELGLDAEQLNLIEPGDVPVGSPVRLSQKTLLTNMEIASLDLDGERVFSDLVKKALLEGQVVLAGHTTNEEQTNRAQDIINRIMQH
jgi:hypothetical protein